MYRRDHIGFVFQDFSLLDSLSVEDNILLPCVLSEKNIKEKKDYMNELCTLLHIDGLQKRFPYELSGGQQQRVLIARALCATEQLLILDEPITGLDPSAIQDFYHLVKKLNKEDGITIIMVSHDIGNVISQANKILHLHRKVVFCGTAEEYKKSVAGKEFLGGEEA